MPSSTLSTLVETLAAAQLDSLRCFQLSYSRLGNAGMAQLIPFLRSRPALQELNLEHNYLEDHAAVALAELLVNLNHVESDCCNSSSDSSSKSTPLSGFLSKLEALSVERNYIYGKGAAALIAAASHHPALRRLDLGHNRFLEEAPGILAYVATTSSERQASPPSASTSQLRFLSLAFTRYHRGTAEEDVAAMETLIGIFQVLAPHRLEALELCFCRFAPECVPKLARLFHVTPILSSLSLIGHKLTSAGAVALVTVLVSTPVREYLTSLNLAYNNISDGDCTPFFHSLPQHAKIEFLGLAFNPLTDRSSSALVAAALQLRRLKDLIIYSFHFHSSSARVDFVTQLAEHPSLETIRIGSCKEVIAPKVPFVVVW